MLHQLAKFIYFKLMGWRFNGVWPELDQCVIIVIPHTHWLDFLVGITVRKALNREMHYIGKKALFKPPHGWFFRWMGGTPVDRSKNTKMVDAVAQIFKEKKVFRFALAPEGTRKKVSTLKTGFWYIAQKAQVPIVMVAFDFGKKEVKFSEPLYTSDSLEKDLEKVHTFFKGVKGKIPENSFG